MRRRDLIAAGLGAVAATVLAGGVAWAAIPEGGVIQGCYDSGGNLKVVASLPCPRASRSSPGTRRARRATRAYPERTASTALTGGARTG